MSKNILLDTDIVIHLLRKQEITVKYLLALKQQGCEFYICPVVTAQ